MQNLQQLIHYILHIDAHLFAFVTAYGTWAYFALVTIIFCETGLIIMPFLPGDSLLFVSGSIAAQPDSSLNIVLLLGLLIIASTLGNQINYAIGRAIGLRLFAFNHSSKLLNKQHLERTRLFYEKHGGKTIIMARFLPIIRTFAPFVAGLTAMNSYHFFLYNLSGAVIWIASLLGFGYFFGSLPVIKEHFSLVIYGIIFISLLPAFLTFCCSAWRDKV